METANYKDRERNCVYVFLCVPEAEIALFFKAKFIVEIKLIAEDIILMSFGLRIIILTL